MKRVLFISSVGGHLTQLLMLKEIFNDYEYLLVTEKTDVTLNLKDKYKKVEYLKYGTRKYLFKYIFILIYNVVKSFNIYIKFKPSVIVTTGSHTAVPICYIAKIFRKKIIYIESFAKINSKNMSGKLIYPIADEFIVQWESMLEIYPKGKYFGSIY